MKQCLILIILILACNCPAQESEQKLKAKLLDEFGDLIYSTIQYRIDNIGDKLRANDQDLIYIVTYRTRYEPPGKNIRYAHFIKRDLEMRLGITAERIVMIDAGEGFCSSKQIWLAPEGTTPDIKHSYKTVFDDTDSPLKFDEIYVDTETPIGNSLPEYTAEIKKQKAIAYVYIYLQYRIENWEDEDSRGRKIINQNINFDSPNEIMRIQRGIKNDLIKKYELSASRIKIVNGGYRKQRQAEFWILPRGVHPPVATPNVFPKVGRRR